MTNDNFKKISEGYACYIDVTDGEIPFESETRHVQCAYKETDKDNIKVTVNTQLYVVYKYLEKLYKNSPLSSSPQVRIKIDGKFYCVLLPFEMTGKQIEDFYGAMTTLIMHPNSGRNDSLLRLMTDFSGDVLEWILIRKGVGNVAVDELVKHNNIYEFIKNSKVYDLYNKYSKEAGYTLAHTIKIGELKFSCMDEIDATSWGTYFNTFGCRTNPVDNGDCIISKVDAWRRTLYLNYDNSEMHQNKATLALLLSTNSDKYLSVNHGELTRQELIEMVKNRGPKSWHSFISKMAGDDTADDEWAWTES